MCRNIRTLHNFEPSATDEEIRASALQYVRKVSGMQKPSAANVAVFERAVDEIAHVTYHLLARPRHLGAAARPRGRGREGTREWPRSASAPPSPRRPRRLSGASSGARVRERADDRLARIEVDVRPAVAERDRRAAVRVDRRTMLVRAQPLALPLADRVRARSDPAERRFTLDSDDGFLSVSSSSRSKSGTSPEPTNEKSFAASGTASSTTDERRLRVRERAGDVLAPVEVDVHAAVREIDRRAAVRVVARRGRVR